ncbi:hypothetical protein KIPE111705_09905 [Kibdelosporangium persicum]|uniref:Uncharacterized protein n=1 Tax=Kibdelosporangium persicum TaxID=2698649 RepID=A0ABX2EZH1_9PSEU|nr:hypothetical protein [Kibdelosporangium persicum]NRN64372.1 hypothetical protein [Kibdelosporangium persicum]
MSNENLSLDLLDRAGVRKRFRMAVIAIVILAAAVGGVIGLIFGQVAGLVAAGVVAVPLLVFSWSQVRRTLWLDGTKVVLRTFGRRAVDLAKAERVEMVVMDVRSVRTVSMLVAETPRSRGINMAVASYSGTGGAELGIFALRKLADALAASANTGSLVISELLVAQLKAEARGEGLDGRPLYQLAKAAPSGKLAVRLRPEAVTKFVASLE